jgi:small subunit ribosomal protein S17
VRQLIGTVISTKNTLSAVVVVETLWKHPLYHKAIRRSKKYLVENIHKAQVGDRVSLEETRPLSARKRFTITQIIKK